MNRKELIKAIKMLNDEEGLLERVGRSKIKTVGKGTATDALQVEFKATMLALEDAKLLDEAPQETFVFYNDNIDDFTPDPGAVEEEGTEEVIKTKPKKETLTKTKKEKDKYSFGVDTRCAMIMALAETGKYTAIEIKNELEGKTKIAPGNVFVVLKKKTDFMAVYDENKVISIVKQ